jgi:hypothetical protein
MNMKRALLAGTVALAAAGAAHAHNVSIPNVFYPFGRGDQTVTFSGVNFVQDASIGNAYLFDIFSVLSSQQALSGVANIDVELPAPTTSVVIDFSTFYGNPVTFAIGGGPTFVEPSTAEYYGAGYVTPDVFEYRSSTPFDSVLITSPDGVLNIGDIAWGIPEPATWAMLLLGVAGLGAALRRRHGVALAAA